MESKDIGFRKEEFVAKTQFLCSTIDKYFLFNVMIDFNLSNNFFFFCLSFFDFLFYIFISVNLFVFYIYLNSVCFQFKFQTFFLENMRLRTLEIKHFPCFSILRDFSLQYFIFIYNIQYTIYNIQYTIYNMQYTIYNIQYTIYI